MSRPLTARRLAIKLVSQYVLRGDSIQDIKDSSMGQGTAGPDAYHVAIGGNRNGKNIGPDWIVVTKLNGRPYFAKFKLADIAASIRRGAK